MNTPGTREHAGMGVVTALALSLSAAACSSQGPETAPALVPTTTIDNPTEESLLTTPVVDECDDNASYLLDLDPAGFLDPETEIGEISDMLADKLNRELPDATPAKIAQYILDETQQEKSGLPPLVFVDETENGLSWSSTKDSAEGVDTRRREQDRVITSMLSIVNALDDYQAGYFTALGVPEIRVVVRNDAEHGVGIGGSYLLGENSINIEITNVMNSGLSQRGARQVVRHEEGHLLDAAYCGEITANAGDNALSPYPYIGVEPQGVALEDHLATVPEADYTYGSDRVLASDYAATEIYERKAELVRVTYETRGLVLPGDADFDSEFGQDQRAMVSRHEAMLPGTKAYLAEITPVLRFIPTHETRIDQLQLIETTYDELRSQAESILAEGKTPVINAIYHQVDSSTRGGTYYLMPIIEVGDHEIDIVYKDYRSAKTGTQERSWLQFGPDSNQRFFIHAFGAGSNLITAAEDADLGLLSELQQRPQSALDASFREQLEQSYADGMDAALVIVRS